jgi:hypothetical protein
MTTTTESRLTFFKLALVAGAMLVVISIAGLIYFSLYVDKDKDKKIASLEREALKSKQNKISTFLFSGQRVEGYGSSLKTIRGSEVKVYERLIRLEQERNFGEIIDLATSQIEKTPKWLTPYLFRGIAYYNTQEIDKAVADLKYVKQRSAGHSDYAKAQQILKQINKEK